MKTSSLERYLVKVEDKLKELEPLIPSSQISIERRSVNRVVLKGTIIFIDSSSLSFLEYVLEEDNRLLMVSYRYHYVRRDGSLIFRYDNAPRHKHLPGGIVIASTERSLSDILDEIKEIVRGE